MFSLPDVIEEFDSLSHLSRHVKAFYGVLFSAFRCRISKKYHYRITDEFIDRTAKIYCYLCHIRKVAVNYLCQFFRFKPIGKLCKPLNIREKYRQIFPVIFL